MKNPLKNLKWNLPNRSPIYHEHEYVGGMYLYHGFPLRSHGYPHVNIPKNDGKSPVSKTCVAWCLRFTATRRRISTCWADAWRPQSCLGARETGEKWLKPLGEMMENDRNLWKVMGTWWKLMWNLMVFWMFWIEIETIIGLRSGVPPRGWHRQLGGSMGYHEASTCRILYRDYIIST